MNNAIGYLPKFLKTKDMWHIHELEAFILLVFALIL